MNKRYALYIFTAAIFIAIVSVGLYIGVGNGHIRLNYPSLKDYPVQGIDVSHHQQKINWGKLDKRFVQFAFIKATEGGNHKDSMFQENWREAIHHNIPVAAYHFFTFCKDGEEQARNYIHYVPKDSIDLPPIIDLEYAGNCTIENRKEDLIAEIVKYMEIIEDHYQRKVLIYTTNKFYKNYLMYQFPDNPIWIRDILSEPNLPDRRGWLFWQFTNKGKLEGIDTPVDLNTFNGSPEDFRKLLIRDKNTY